MTASVRYIVNNVDEALPFYTEALGFTLLMHPAPGFAALSLGDLRLNLNQPGAGGAGTAMPDGSVPAPGGWNRIQVEVDTLDSTLARLREAGVTEHKIVDGIGGRQALVEDASGNRIELFERSET